MKITLTLTPREVDAVMGAFVDSDSYDEDRVDSRGRWTGGRERLEDRKARDRVIEKIIEAREVARRPLGG